MKPSLLLIKIDFFLGQHQIKIFISLWKVQSHSIGKNLQSISRICLSHKVGTKDATWLNLSIKEQNSLIQARAPQKNILITKRPKVEDMLEEWGQQLDPHKVIHLTKDKLTLAIPLKLGREKKVKANREKMLTYKEVVPCGQKC